MMTTLKEDIEKKLAIRHFARENMGLSPENVKPDIEKDFERLLFPRKVNGFTIELESLKNDIARVQAHSIQSEYWELKSNRKIIGPCIVFVKKFLRKFQHVLFGWFIQHILNQQTQFNQSDVLALNHIHVILGRQRDELMKLGAERDILAAKCEMLQKQIEVLRAELQEQMDVQREEYITMFRYYNKNS